MKIEINKKRCKKCGICYSFCPKNVLEKGEDGYPSVIKESECVGCKLCEMRCPDLAITVEETKWEK